MPLRPPRLASASLSREESAREVMPADSPMRLPMPTPVTSTVATIKADDEWNFVKD